MKWPIILIFLAIFSQNLYAQFIGARLSAMSDCYNAKNDPWNINGNPAGMISNKSKQIAFDFSNPYTIHQLASKSLIGNFKWRENLFGCSISNYGFNLYRIFHVGFAYQKKLSPSFSGGIKLQYSSLKIPEYANEHALFAVIGTQYSWAKKHTLGFSIFNPFSAGKNTFLEKELSTNMALGYAIHLNNQFAYSIDLLKPIDSPLQINQGLEYNFLQKFDLRTGIKIPEAIPSFGFGFELKNYHLDFSSSYHYDLGYSPEFSLSYEF